MENKLGGANSPVAKSETRTYSTIRPEQPLITAVHPGTKHKRKFCSLTNTDGAPNPGHKPSARDSSSRSSKLRNWNMEGRVRHTAEVNSAVESNRRGAVVASVVDINTEAGTHGLVEGDRYAYESINIGSAKSSKWAASEHSSTAASTEESVRATMGEVAGYSG